MQRKGFLAACAGALAALGLPIPKRKAPSLAAAMGYTQLSATYTYVGDTALTVDGMQNAFVLSSMAMVRLSHDGIWLYEDGKKTRLGTQVVLDPHGPRGPTGFNWYGA